MTIEVSNDFPIHDLRLIVDGKLNQVNSNEYFADKKIILVGVPGAFTPTCHISHLPGYVDNIAKFNEKGYSIVFFAVNDPFVMMEWSAASNASGIDMIADGNCDLAETLGLTMDGSEFGLGKRCIRFAMIIENGVVTSLDLEEGGALDVSSAEVQLEKI